MRALFLTIVAGLAVATAAAAQPADSPATLCLDGLGVNHAPICHTQTASRIDTKPDICLCRGPYRRVDAPWCAPGESPPPESADYEHARAAAAEKDNSLFGDTYHGQRMCVSARSN